MKRNIKKGFTLVELLAVIVILAIILVIAVPKVMSVIEDSKKATLESTAKMIASSAEKAKVQNAVLGNSDAITCDSVAKINDLDYEDCDIDFDGNTAKVTIKGSGKFNGLWVCNGTKTNANAINESCGLRMLTIELDGGTVSENQNGKYEAGSEVILTQPTKEGYTFNGWTATGAGASVDGNILTMGSEATTVTATWNGEVVDTYAATYISNLYKNEAQLNNGLQNPKVMYNNVEYDTGIRYVSNSNPIKNKVYYNCDDEDSNGVSYGSNDYDYAGSCEVWRIIGVFNTKSSTSSDAVPRVKLINTSSTFTASWDSSYGGYNSETSQYYGVNSGYGINQWGSSGNYEGADLMQLLNGYYIGLENSTCTYCNGDGQETCSQSCTIESLKTENMKVLTSNAKDMIQNAVWDTYAVNENLWPEYYDYSDIFGEIYGSEYYDIISGFADAAYLQEKGISTQYTGKSLCETNGGHFCNDSVTRTTNWTGLVGLMSVSDMKYSNGWLYNTYYPYTITPVASINAATAVWGYYQFNVKDDMGYSTSIYVDEFAPQFASFPKRIFPTVYLSSSVKIIGGDGYANPYKLSNS